MIYRYFTDHWFLQNLTFDSQEQLVFSFWTNAMLPVMDSIWYDIQLGCLFKYFSSSILCIYFN